MGTGFTGATEVDFNGHSAPFSVQDQAGTEIIAFVPSTSTLGYNYITVKKPGSSNTSTNPFTIIGAGPYIDSFTQSGAVGSAITIYGAHFTPFQTGAGTLTFNGTAASYDPPTSDQQLTVYVPSGATTGQLKATTSSGSWTSTNLFYFRPGITSFSPTNGRAGTNIVIKGTNFLGVSSVSIGGLNAVTFTTNSNTQITAVIPDNAVSDKVHVVAPAGQFITSSNFFVVPNIVSFSPFAGVVGTSVTLTGSNLNGGNLTIKFNGATATVTASNFSTITTSVPQGATSGAITVQSVDGTMSTVTNFFLPPSISSITTNAPVGGTVTITGVNFTNATSVQFNGINATSFNVVSNTQITAVVPAGATSGQITVVTPGGSATSLQDFFGAPIINAVKPPSGVVGINVEILGTNFLGLTAVKFNGVSAHIDYTSGTNILTTVPVGATTGPITLFTDGGNVNSSTFFIEPLLLGITNLDAQTVRISWTTNAPGFQLQSATNLLSTNTVWSNDTNTTQIIGGLITVTNNTTGIPQKTYRLQK